jgi:hypothetical protein
MKNREQQIDFLLNQIMNNPSSDYNEGLVREAVRTYLNNFNQQELIAELEERGELCGA